MVFTAAIARVSFDRVDNAVLNPFNDTGMIGFSVLRTGAAFVIPIEEDYHTWCRFDIVICPLATILEPVDTVDTACVFGNYSSLDTEKGISDSNTRMFSPTEERSDVIIDLALLVRLSTIVSRMPSILSLGLICRLILAIERKSKLRPLVDRKFG